MNPELQSFQKFSYCVKLCAFAGFLALFLISCSQSKAPAQTSHENARIISFAPNITETLFALSLGDRVVGVTRFDTYPPQVKNIPKIGGYFDPNYEMILSLKPSLVILLKEHASLIDFLSKRSINHMSIDDENIDGILNSFSTIAAACGVKARGDSLADSIRRELSLNRTFSGYRPRVVLCVGRDNPGGGNIGKIFLAGPKTFYSELLFAAGAQNAYQDSSFAYPSFSGEGIIRLHPDIIIDLMASVTNIPADKIAQDWNQFTMIPAVQAHQVYSLTGDYLTIPGPRITLIYNDIKNIVNKWNDIHSKQ